MWKFFLCVLLQLFAVGNSRAIDAGAPTALPLLQIPDLDYIGAFRLPATTFGASNLNFAEGPLEYRAASHSIFIVGHDHQQAIAEFGVPALVDSEVLASLNMADAPLQIFATVLDRTPDGNPQNLNQIGGLEIIVGPDSDALLVNAYEYYDAPADNTHTSLLVHDANKFATATVQGFYRFAGGAGHTSGWISPIPPEWQAALGGTHLTGHSSGIPIISRSSVGPSAFAFNPQDMLAMPDPSIPVATIGLLDFSLAAPLHEDLRNDSGSNALWTHLSRVTYGFIAPGSSTYVTIGHSGGHASGVCYKCVQHNGNRCGGYCAPDPDDYYHYYWLWNVNDLLAVRNGQMSPAAVRPYDDGVLELPFATAKTGGGTFDPTMQRLYLRVLRADTEQGQYANPPVVLAFALNINGGGENSPQQIPALNLGMLVLLALTLGCSGALLQRSVTARQHRGSR